MSQSINNVHFSSIFACILKLLAGNTYLGPVEVMRQVD